MKKETLLLLAVGLFLLYPALVGKKLAKEGI
jgi:hypothetical protein